MSRMSLLLPFFVKYFLRSRSILYCISMITNHTGQYQYIYVCVSLSLLVYLFDTFFGKKKIRILRLHLLVWVITSCSPLSTFPQLHTPSAQKMNREVYTDRGGYWCKSLCTCMVVVVTRDALHIAHLGEVFLVYDLL